MSFIKKYTRYFQKNIETEPEFSKIEIDNEWNFSFLLKFLFAFHPNNISTSFSLINSPLKFYVTLSHRICCNILHIFKLYPWEEFLFLEKEKRHKQLSMILLWDFLLSQTRVLPKKSIQNVSRLPTSFIYLPLTHLNNV